MGRAAGIIITLSAGWLLLLTSSLSGQTIPVLPGEQLNLYLKYDNPFSTDLIIPNITSVELSPSQEFNLHLKYDDAYLKDWIALNIKSAKSIFLRPEAQGQHRADRDLLNKLTSKPKIDEKDEIRQAWKEVFGMDVWYAYYKAKEIEDWVREKASFRIFKMKCKPKFQRNSIVYTCKTTF